MKLSTDQEMTALLDECGHGIKQEIANKYGLRYNILHDLITGKRQSAKKASREVWRERIVGYCKLRLWKEKAFNEGFAAAINSLPYKNPYQNEITLIWGAWEDGFTQGANEVKEQQPNHNNMME